MTQSPISEQSTRQLPFKRHGPVLPWSIAALAASTCFVMGIAFSAPPKLEAKQDPQTLPTFLKFGRNYICLQKISHIIDDPGQNLPPGSVSIYFAGGGQSWINLFGDEAGAFRQAVDQMTTDLSPAPKPAASEAAAKKVPSFLRKSAAPIPSTAAPAAAPAAPAAAPTRAPQVDPGI